MMNIESIKNSLWVEKYRPKIVDEAVLSEDLKKFFQKLVDDKFVPNLLLAGGPGVGKTTIARAMLEQLDCDYIVINGSLSGNIDTLRNDIRDFASTVSFHGGRKYVILDEADFINPNSTQPALRNFMEEFSKNCGFILTCNYINKIIPALQSRCSIINFKIDNKDKPKIAAQFFKRVCSILDTENVEYDKGAVAEVINKYFPDWRRVLNELQRYSSNGKIDSSILSWFSDETFRELIGILKDKKFESMRKWVEENSDQDSHLVMRKFYDCANEHIKSSSIPDLILILSKYQYQAAFAVDQTINTAAMLTEIMVEVEWK